MADITDIKTILYTEKTLSLGEKGVELGVGTHYEGITIDPSTARFSIDSTKIVENYALGPGHYELIITLKADPSQSTRVSITVPQYNVPTIVFTDEKKKKVYGKEISGDTLQLGRWAYEMYEVNVKFEEDWAEVTTYNKILNISMSNPLVGIFDKDGNPISKVTLDTSTENFYWGSRLIGALADKCYAATQQNVERYQDAVAVRSRQIIREYDRKMTDTGDFSLTKEANEKLCAMCKEETISALNKVLLTASEHMKNGFNLADN